MRPTTIRLRHELLRDIDDLAERGASSRSAVLRCALRRGIRALRLDRAAAAYQRGDGSLGWCAQEAGVTAWDLLEERGKRGVGMRTDEGHLREQLKALDGRSE